MSKLGPNRIVLTGMGHWHPKTVLDNDFFDSLDIGSSSQWIEDVVGIKERRSVMSRDDIVALRHGKITREELFKAGRITSMAEMCKKTWKFLMIEHKITALPTMSIMLFVVVRSGLEYSRKCLCYCR